MLASSKCLFFCLTRSVAHLFSHHSLCRLPYRLLCFFLPIECIYLPYFWLVFFPFPNPLLGGWFVSRRLLLSQLHFYFVAPKSRSSFVANIRYIVYDCSSSIGQRCAGSRFAISNIGHHSAIVPLLALYRRLFCHSILYLYSIVLLWFHATIVLAHSSLLRLNLSLKISIAFLGYISELPCWSAHNPLSAHTLSVVILHRWLLYIASDTTNFLISITPLFATLHAPLSALRFAFHLYLFTFNYLLATLTFYDRFW